MNDTVVPTTKEIRRGTFTNIITEAGSAIYCRRLVWKSLNAFALRRKGEPSSKQTEPFPRLTYNKLLAALTSCVTGQSNWRSLLYARIYRALRAYSLERTGWTDRFEKKKRSIHHFELLLCVTSAPETERRKLCALWARGVGEDDGEEENIVSFILRIGEQTHDRSSVSTAV